LSIDLLGNTFGNTAFNLCIDKSSYFVHYGLNVIVP
jgi:hypothetical protein